VFQINGGGMTRRSVHSLDQIARPWPGTVILWLAATLIAIGLQDTVTAATCTNATFAGNTFTVDEVSTGRGIGRTRHQLDRRGSHAWWDKSASGSGAARYWLEDLDLNGQRSWHGPISVAPPTHPGSFAPLGQAQAMPLSSLGRASAHSRASGPSMRWRRAHRRLPSPPLGSPC
jgi:hypothetical protein